MDINHRQAQEIARRAWLSVDVLRRILATTIAPERDLATELQLRGLLSQAQSNEVRHAAMSSGSAVLTPVQRPPTHASGARDTGPRDTGPRDFSAGPSSPSEKSLAPSQQRRAASAAVAAELAQDPLFAAHADYVFDQQGELGEGGMGKVVLVEDRRLGRQAALKLMSGTASEARVARFLRELRITARLDHPAVPPVYEIGRNAAGQHYMLMRVIRGRTLREEIDQAHDDGPPGLRELRPLIEILHRVAEALAYAHSQGIVHRDLKPENIMLGEFGEVMVLDWGVARDLREDRDPTSLLKMPESKDAPSGSDDARLTRADSLVGTLSYMSPEQARAEDVDARSDVYALALLLTELLTGKPALQSDTPEGLYFAALEGHAARPRDRSRQIPRDLNAIADMALQANRSERTSRARDFAEALHCWLADEPVPDFAYSLWDRALRLARRRPAALMASAAALLLASLGLALGTELRAAQKNLAESQARTQAAEDAVKVLAAAEARLRRGVPASEVAPDVEEALKTLPSSPPTLIQAAQILARCQRLERAEAVLREADRLDPSSLEALLALHELMASRSKQAASESQVLWTPALDELLSRAAKSGKDNAYTLFAKATRAFSKDDFKLAESTLAGLETISDRFIPGLMLRGLARRQLGLYDQAIRDFDRVLSLQPESPEAFLQRGWAREAKGEAKEANEDYGRALALAPRMTEVVLRRGNLRLNLRDLQGAKADAALGLELAPERYYPWLLRGMILMDEGRYKEARMDFEKACQLNPENIDAHCWRAEAFIALQNPREAERILSKILDLDPRSLRALNVRANLLRRERRFAEAAEAYKILTEIDPKQPPHWNNYGICQADLGQERLAIEAYEKALDLDPRDVIALTNRGNSYSRLKKFPAALADYKAALSISDKPCEIYFVRALTYEQLGDVDSALADLDAAIKAEPSFAKAYNTRANLKSQKGDILGAIEDYGLCVKYNPNHALAWRNRGSALLEQGDATAALRDLNRAIELQSDYHKAWRDRAKTHEALGDIQAALRDWTKSIELQPADLASRAQRGKLCVDNNLRPDFIIEDYSILLNNVRKRAESDFLKSEILKAQARIAENR
jgi:tetratricopeptide (TPR) repeat protein